MKHSFIRILAVLTAIVLLLCAAPFTASAASDPRTAGDYVYTVEGGNATLINYNGADKVIAVPSVIDNCPVTALNLTFQENSDVTEITLPASVVSVAPMTFECDNLKSITVAGDNPVFTSLDGVLYSKDMKTLVAYPCGGEKNFTVPAPVEHIADYAFFRCYKLISVAMHNNVTTIGDNAFAFCWNMRTVRLSDNLTSIAGEAFLRCGWLTTMTLPVNVASIGKDALLGFLGSDGAPRYHLADGVYCVKGSFADKYIGGIRITSVRKYVPDSRFDLATGITAVKPFGQGTRVNIESITDGTAHGAFEALRVLDSSLLYSSLYSVTATKNGAASRFYDIGITVPVPSGFAASISKIYVASEGELLEITDKTSVYSNNRQAFSFTLPESGLFAVVEKFTYTIPGDVDGDGAVTTSDARFTLRAAAQLDSFISEQLPAADIDGVAGISTSDARKILRKAASLE